ncbi:transposase [Lutibacter sp.]|uniref:IS110 family transposase n=1 Tax=Lutibacter sp. TaxID=1925666 RepID=UPI0025C48F5D|nr:transposase [Lutibacter sp.]MCF6167130.1 transposase [Lutibacter sp.]
MKKTRKHVAGIDIGAKKLFVSIENQPVKTFDTFTEDLELLSSYLVRHKIATVAMEATGVYWVILYDILVSYGLDVWLVDARSTKQVPGRKTDVKDCQWIQQLHS